MLQEQSQSLYKIAKTILLALFLLGATAIYAQSTTITGEVYDRNRLPLPGVSVTLKSSAKVNTATDIDGQFSIKVSEDLPVTLVFNYLGYKTQEVDVYDSQESVNVTLSENNNILDEVVVTALGITKDKKSLGYTTQELKSSDLEGNKEQNLLNSLSGKVAGVRITNSQGDMGSSRIVIRGETSIAGNNQPLFVVDGVPVDNQQHSSAGDTRDFRNAIADLNPEDIESMSVLKGANAAALYGSRAAQGVVLITTKSGKGQKGIGVTYNSGVTFATVATLPKFQNTFGQGSDGLFSYVDGKGGGINDGVDESWGPRMDGRLIPQFFSNGEAVPFVAHPNNVRDFFNTGVTFNNGVSIAGSDEKYNYRLGINHENQKGVVPNTQIKKTNFILNTSYQLTKRVKIGATANYIVTDVPNLPGSAGVRASGVMLQFIWFGRQVDMNQLKSNRNVNWNNSYFSNPYWNAYYNTTEQQRNRFIGSVNADINLAKGLDFKFRTGTDYYTDRRMYRIRYGTNGTPFGSYAEDAYTFTETNTDAILTYTRQLTDDIQMDALGGFAMMDKSIRNNYQKAPRLAIPDLYTLNNSMDPLLSLNTLEKKRVNSLYGSVQFGYKGYAFVTVTNRNDWSSTLPRANRSFMYPSVNGTLLLTEALDIRSDVLSFLKLRAGWAKVGNGGDPYLLENVFNIEAPFKGNAIQTSSKVKNNPDLKPEMTRSTEIGTEAAFFKNRVRLDLALYNSTSFNQIITVNTSAASGYTSKVMNAGELNNKGIEIQVGGSPIDTKRFKWDVAVNYSANRSKVAILDSEGLLQNYVIGSNSVDVLASVGKRYGILYGTAYLRDDNGNIVVGSDGLPKADPEKKVLGHFTPDWLGGITNTFTYKNMSLSFLIDASIGGSIYSGTNRYGNYAGVLEQTLPGRGLEYGGIQYYYPNNDRKNAPVALNGGTPPAGTTVYEDGMIFKGVLENGDPNQRIVSAQNYYKSSYNIDEEYVYKADYVKLREVAFTYAVNKSFAKSIGLQGANVSAFARNLFFIYKNAPNIDPETAFNTGNAQGLESLSLPTTRSFGVNVSLQF